MAIGAPRLKGQEMQLLVLDGANRVDEIKAITSQDNESKLEIKQEGFLGEVSDEYDTVYSGEGGSFEFQVHKIKWLTFKARIIAKAKREQPTITFNIVHVWLFANGDSLLRTYLDIAWGAISESAGSRKDYVKVKMQYACSEASEQQNAFI